MDKEKRRRLRKQKRRQEMVARRKEFERRDAEEMRSIGAEPEPTTPPPQYPGFRPGIIPPHIRKRAEKEEDEDDFDPGPESFMTGGDDD